MWSQPTTTDPFVYEEWLLPLQYIYILLLHNLVHPSYKSQTAIRIVRKQLPLPPLQKIVNENPYVYKPKSYSRKRGNPEPTLEPYTQSPLTKKFKKNPTAQQTFNSQNQLDQSYVNLQLKEPLETFFGLGFKRKQRMEQEKELSLPLKGYTSQVVRENRQLAHKIQIVSTQNHKIFVPIHEALLKANTNHSKVEQSMDGIVNPFDSNLKKYYSDRITFVRDYKSGYTPIQMQNRSKKADDKEGGYDEPAKTGPKSHFIRKKQSTLSLSRTCGVSYIKPSQSSQGAPFEPLPPIIFQCSTSCNYTEQLRQIYGGQISELINLSQNRWIPFILTTEEHMRDLLLGKPFGRVFWVYGIHNLWPLFNEGNFLLVLFKEQWAGTEEQVWQQFQTCPFKFGILAKKSTSGKKLFLKSIQLQGDKEETLSVASQETTLDKKVSMKPQEGELNQPKQENLCPIQMAGTSEPAVEKEEKKVEEQPLEQRKQCKDVCQQFMRQLKNSRTVITMSLKFEMYVHQHFWKGISPAQKNLLNAIIHSFEQHLQKKSIQVIRDRLELAKGTYRQELLTKAFSYLRVGRSIQQFNAHETYIHDNTNRFTIGSIASLNTALSLRQPQILPGLPSCISDILKDKSGHQNMGIWEKALKMPIYYISTRDSFAFDLVEKVTFLQRECGKTYKKIEYFFESDNLPQNYGQYRNLFPDLRVGATCYHDFFTEQELQYFENNTLATERSAFKNNFLQMTVQPTIVGNRIKRTKFFFGYRYMWTRCQLAEPHSYVGAGVRRDVTPAPKWISQIQNPLVESGIVEPNFLNAISINVYHDGTQGLAQHFDDAVRFKQPIYTLRLVSDGRLSFGSQFYGFCNGAFIIPLPRGCICMFEQNSYAANGVKHCVRPCDMSGKSVAIILRQMHHQVVSEAAKYDEMIDFPSWLSTLSEDPQATTFAEQKRREAEELIADEQNGKLQQKEKTKILLELK